VIVAGQPDGRFVTRAREGGLETAPVRMRSAWDLSAAARLTRLIRGEGVSVVHTHSSVDGWLGGLAARAARVPVVRTRHVSIPVRRGFNPVYTWLADRVITSGEAIRRIILAAGVPAGRVVAIPAGVDLDTLPFRTAPFRTGAPAALPNLRLSSPVIGCVAMFRGSKGHAHLLEAFAAVRAIHPTATLLLVGDGIRRTWVEGLAREAGLAEHVVFTGFSDDVPALLAMMDCFVLASTRTEGVPQSLLQAFAAGVPVVASDIGGVPEVVADGVTGLLAKSGSAAALAAGIARVLSDTPGAVRRAEAARALVEERFSHAASISRLLQLYGELLAAAPTLRPAA
jgi:glycosyltransferase involved in cell wall biosynthesis